MNSRKTIRGAAVVCMGAMLLGGCARHVTQDRATIDHTNSAAWTIRQSPAGTDLPVQTVSATSSSKAHAADAEQNADRPVDGTHLFRNRPDVAKALRSPADSFGIPAELYKVDPLLEAHRREIESQARARHQAGAGTIVLGLVAVGVAAFALGVGIAYSDSPNESQRNSAAQAAGSGMVCGLIGIGTVIGGIVMAAGSSDPAPLQTYYRETYAR